MDDENVIKCINILNNMFWVQFSNINLN